MYNNYWIHLLTGGISISNEVIVSTYSDGKLYFAVAVKDGKILKATLPKADEESVLDEISTGYTSFKLTDEYKQYAKDVCMAYYGKNMRFNASIPNKDDFKSKVLQEVAKIPYGEIRTYKQISESIGTNAYRAVGTAIGRNPLPIIIPCHRVVKSDFTTLWQGIIIGSGFLPIAVPTALYALVPMDSEICL